MAEHDSTLRTRFAQSKLQSNFQSDFVVKTNFIKSPAFAESPASAESPVSFHDTLTEPNVSTNKPAIGFSVTSLPVLSVSSLSHDNFPTTMETLRSHVNYLLCLPLPVAVKNRLRLKYWALQRRLEAVCLLLDEAQENKTVLGEAGIDPSCFDLSCLDLSVFYLSGLSASGLSSSSPDSSGLKVAVVD